MLYRRGIQTIALIIISTFFLIYSLVSKDNDEIMSVSGDYFEALRFEQILKNFSDSLYYPNNGIETEQNDVSHPLPNNSLGWSALSALYHQQYLRWKQKGEIKSLESIERAIELAHDPADVAFGNATVTAGMKLHKTLLMAHFGCKSQALSESVANQKENYDLVSANDQSLLLYHEAELLHSLFDSPYEAALLYRKSIQQHVCNPNAVQKLAVAIKDAREASREEIAEYILEIETHLASITELPNRAIIYKSWTNVSSDLSTSWGPPTEAGARGVASSTSFISSLRYIYSFFSSTVFPFLFSSLSSTSSSLSHSWQYVCTFETTNLLTTVSSLNNVVSLPDIKSKYYTALFTLADMAEDYSLAWYYLGRSRALMAEYHAIQTGVRRRDDHHGEGSKDGIAEQQAMEGSAATAAAAAATAQRERQGANGQAQQQQPSVVYNLEDSIARTAQIKATYLNGFWPELSTAEKRANRDPKGKYAYATLGSTSKIPIFIVGFFRSGSTLLEAMLNAHRNIYGAGEDSLFLFQMHAMHDELFTLIHERNAEAKAKKEDENDKDKEKEKDKIERKDKKKQQSNKKNNEEGTGSEENAAGAGLDDETFAKVVKKHADMFLKKLKSKYREQMQIKRKYKCSDGRNLSEDISSASSISASTASTSTAATSSTKIQRIVDKMLGNYVNIGLIHLLFPNAIIINMVRDPIDTLWSCMRNRFGDPSAAYTMNVTELVREYGMYLEIMQHFREELPDAQKTIIDVRYEELVVSPQRVLRNLIVDKLGLEWDPAVLKHEEAVKKEGSVHTLSALQVRYVRTWCRKTLPFVCMYRYCMHIHFEINAY